MTSWQQAQKNVLEFHGATWPVRHSLTTSGEDEFASAASVTCCVHRIPLYFADKDICMHFTSGETFVWRQLKWLCSFSSLAKYFHKF